MKIKFWLRVFLTVTVFASPIVSWSLTPSPILTSARASTIAAGEPVCPFYLVPYICSDSLNQCKVNAAKTGCLTPLDCKFCQGGSFQQCRRSASNSDLYDCTENFDQDLCGELHQASICEFEWSPELDFYCWCKPGPAFPDPVGCRVTYMVSTTSCEQ